MQVYFFFVKALDSRGPWAKERVINVLCSGCRIWLLTKKVATLVRVATLLYIYK